MGTYILNDELYHHGVLGMKWGVRRYQSYAENPKLSDRKRRKINSKVSDKINKYNQKINKYESRRQSRLKSNEDWRRQSEHELREDNELYKIQKKLDADSTKANKAQAEEHYRNLKTYQNRAWNGEVPNTPEAETKRKEIMERKLSEIRGYDKQITKIEGELRDADKVLMNDIANSNKWHEDNARRINNSYDKKIAKTNEKINAYKEVQDTIGKVKQDQMNDKSDRVQEKFDKKLAKSQARDETFNDARARGTDKAAEKYGKDSAHVEEWEKTNEYYKQGQNKYNEIVRNYGRLKAAATRDPSIKSTPEYKAAKKLYDGQKVLDWLIYGDTSGNLTKIDYANRAYNSDKNNVDWESIKYRKKDERREYKEKQKASR